jgi:Rrf2 family nitric oxide-sensitive transcriptional repressor
VKLLRPPSEIRLGEVVRKAEPGFRMVECFDPETNTCPIISACRLKTALEQALESFFDSLNRHTLADLVSLPAGQRLSNLLQIESTR